MNAIIKYIQSTRAELKHVAWPTQMQTAIYTALVIAISIAVALYLGFFDFFFTRGLEELVGNMGGGSYIDSPIQVDVEENPIDIDFDVAPNSDASPNSLMIPSTHGSDN
jgi:preprotein translocase SecE subunit